MLLCCAAWACRASADALAGDALADLQRAYVERRFGMFLHFNMGTFTGEEWASPLRPVDTFAPSALDTDQWAASAKAAGMTYGVLTTKHHDGFALWDSGRSGYDVAATAWYAGQPPGKGDIVRRYADSFRAQGLKVGLYYSIWDKSNGIDGTRLTSRQATDYVKDELAELLTHYGPVHAIWTDGWGWKLGYAYVPYQEVYDHIKALSPGTLLVENNHSATNTDIRTWEQTPLPPAGNAFPSELSVTVRADNKWFWSAGANSMKTFDKLVFLRDAANGRGAACLLDVTPDTRGLIPDSQLSMLAQLGADPLYRSLALDRPAAQSSVWTNATYVLGANQAVDGLTGGFNMAHTMTGDLAPWWRVTLAQPSEIARVVIENRPGYAGRLRDITVSVLDADLRTVYASPALNPGNILGGGISVYTSAVPALLDLDLPSGVPGLHVHVTRAPEGSVSGDQYYLTLPEVYVFGREKKRPSGLPSGPLMYVR